MRIAQVSPLYESVPPSCYGGTERIVSFLTEELVRLGHDVTLFASGDSRTAAELVAVCPEALRLSPARDKLCQHIYLMEQVARRAHEFDLIHWHIDYLHFPLSRRLKTPHLTTLHGRLDLPELSVVYDEFGDMPVVSISHSQREPLPQAWWFGNVYHGIPGGSAEIKQTSDGYLAFLGRICPEKRVDRAIEIAKAVNRPLKIAAKVDPADRDYFKQEIEGLLEHPLIEFLGEIGDDEKPRFLGEAAALLFPIDWPEPFGLVMIESMARGTPVIAFRHGSVPEIIDHGLTGFVVDDMEAAVECTKRVGELDRRAIRAVFEERFSATRMVLDYLELYENLCYIPRIPRSAGNSISPHDSAVNLRRL